LFEDTSCFKDTTDINVLNFGVTTDCYHKKHYVSTFLCSLGFKDAKFSVKDCFWLLS